MSGNLVFVGAPGSGKGTQASKLATNFSFEHVSTGDLLRAEIAKESELGKKVKKVMEDGQLVSDDLVAELLKANLDLDSKKYIFDGYPRNLNQAKTLDEIVGNYPYQVIFFDINTDALVERLTNRRVSRDGKHIYNLKFNPPKVPGKCDVTGQDLIQRDDDKEEVVRNRMKIFHESIEPMLAYYESKGKLLKIDAMGSPDEIYNKIKAVLE